MQQVFGKNVKVSLPKSYHSANATKGKILVVKGVSTNITVDDFKDLLEFYKITHAEAERMTSKRLGRDLPFIKLKCDDPKQAKALISGGFMCQKTGIISRSKNLGQCPRSNNVSSAKVLGTRHQTAPKNQNVLCVVKHILIKTALTKITGNQNVLIVGDLISPITKALLLTRSSLQAACSSKTNFICLHPRTSFTTTLQQHI